MMPGEPEIGNNNIQETLPPEIPQNTQELSRTATLVAAREGTGQFTNDPEMMGNVGPDRKDGMAEAAVIEAQQNAEIERLAMEAAAISPDFENGMREELQETAKETLRMKIESKVYDLLTAIETKVGKGVIMQSIREGMAGRAYIAMESKAGRYTSEVPWDQRAYGRELVKTNKIARENLRNGNETVTFTPGGIRTTESWNYPTSADRPGATHEYNTGTFEPGDRVVASGYSSPIHGDVKMAQYAIERNPVINKLEEWREKIKIRQEATRGAAQMVSAYGASA